MRLAIHLGDLYLAFVKIENPIMKIVVPAFLIIRHNSL